MLRIDDEEVKYFEALWRIPKGITYNSYILITNEGALLLIRGRTCFLTYLLILLGR